MLQQLQEFGLKVTLTTIDVPTLTQNRLNGNYQLHHDGGGMDVPDPDYLRTIFHSKLGKTYATGVGFKIDRLDQLLEEGARTLDVDKRKTIYAEAEKILVDEVPYIWLTWRVQAEALDPKLVKGYEQLPDALASYNIGRMEYLWLNR